MAMHAAAQPPRGENPRISKAIREISTGAWEALPAEEILTRAVEYFHPRLALSCSFGNPAGMVLLHLLKRIEPAARIFTIDTGRLPQESYDLLDRVREHYETEIEVLLPDPQPIQEMVQRHGVNLFYDSLEKRRLCCKLRKVEPNLRYLAGLDACITGLSRDQGITRAKTRKAEIAEDGRLVKLSPLADWDRDRVMRFVREHGVPINRLHQRGYASVGCAPCTRAVPAGAPARSGRWWWEQEETRECGLHPGQESGGSGI